MLLNSQLTEVIFQEMFILLNYNLEYRASILFAKNQHVGYIKGTFSNTSFSRY